MKRFQIGYQLYSAREDAQKDLCKTLKRLAEIGYDGVEFAGLYGNSVGKVKTALAEAGLKAFSAHVPYAEFTANMDGTISTYKALGCSYIVVPYLDEATRPGSAGFAKVCQNIWIFAEKCSAAGIQLLYHNHDFEFVKLSGEYGLDFLYDLLPERLLKTEIDTCWVKYAGEDPAAFLKKYANRAPIIHLKDYVGVKGGASPYALIGLDEDKKHDNVAFTFKPFGFGCQDAKAILCAASDTIADILVIEQDESVERPALDSAEMSYSTLKKLGIC
ncbi:MAG: sugar phosphate isomerase/epimerase [Eubacteriales bacterium]|nr:sugar phosphate isomerase/epimerase [Eubacteriales bacterium]MDD3882071.1 sugar phosphate isomerase/epimerase [Eubacteriales bacterium]MDD4512518.1 sugar phosphate isomerase/epimerase [Eubacteriales bacterium]